MPGLRCQSVPRRVKLLLEPSGAVPLPAISVALGTHQVFAQLGVLTFPLLAAVVPRLPLPPRPAQKDRTCSLIAALLPGRDTNT